MFLNYSNYPDKKYQILSYRPPLNVSCILNVLFWQLFSLIQESVDLRRQAVMSNQIIDARGRKFSKRLVDIRELNEQAKVIDDLK